MRLKSRHATWAFVLVSALFAFGCGSDGDSDLMAVADGKVAPASAEMKWEQEVPAGVLPVHVIRRFTSDDSPASVVAFYEAELGARGWQREGGDASYREWRRDGMVISLSLERAGSATEWSLALFAAD